MTPAQFAATARQEQFGIYDGRQNLIGRAWGDVVRTDVSSMVTITGTVLLDRCPAIPAIRIETETQFDNAGELDNFTMDLFGVPMTPIKIHGERRGIYFPCELNLGPLHRTANLDMSASRMIGESVRPLNMLPKLHVGQSWRMQLLDPVSAVISKKTEFRSVVARVTGKETIATDAGPRECFVVEIQGQGKAWVADDGNILRQEVNAPIPVIGKLTIVAEEYKQSQRDEAKQRVSSMYRPEHRGPHDSGD